MSATRGRASLSASASTSSAPSAAAVAAAAAARAAAVAALAPRTLKQYFDQPGALSQYDVARKVGCTQPFISLVMQRKRACSFATAKKIHALTGVPMETLQTKIRRAPKKGGGGGPPGALPLFDARDDTDNDISTDDAHDDHHRPPHLLAH